MPENLKRLEPGRGEAHDAYKSIFPTEMLTLIITILLIVAGTTAYLRQPTATPLPATPTVQPCPNHGWVEQTEKEIILARIAKMGIRPGETHNLHLR